MTRSTDSMTSETLSDEELFAILKHLIETSLHGGADAGSPTLDSANLHAKLSYLISYQNAWQITSHLTLKIFT